MKRKTGATTTKRRFPERFFGRLSVHRELIGLLTALVRLIAVLVGHDR
jgi:hypothetical protein